jgi:hypothetical protein
LALIAVGLMTTLVGLQLAPASAKVKLNSFAGNCTFQGTVGFSPPATNTQQTLSTWYDATGSCSGQLNGKQISDAPVTMSGRVDNVDGSCIHAQTTEPGRGAITFADGTSIKFTFEFTYVLTEGTWTIEGERSGSAIAKATFLTDRTSPDVSDQCAGEGVREIPMDTQLATQSPLVSGPGHRNR